MDIDDHDGEIYRRGLLRVHDVASRLGVPPSTVRWWLREGRIAHVRLGPRTPRFRPADVEAFLDAHAVGADTKGDGGAR